MWQFFILSFDSSSGISQFSPLVSHEISVPVSVFAGQIQLHGSFDQMIKIVLNFSQGKHDGRAESLLPAHSFLKKTVDFCEILKAFPGLIPVQANKRQKNSFGDDAVLLKKPSGVLIQRSGRSPGGDAGKKHPVHKPHFMDPMQKPHKAPVDKDIEEQGITPYRQLFLIGAGAFEDVPGIKIGIRNFVFREPVDGDAVLQIKHGEVVPVGSEHIQPFRGRHHERTHQKGNGRSQQGKGRSFRDEVIRGQGGMLHQKSQQHDHRGGHKGHKEPVETGKGPAPEGEPGEDDEEGQKAGGIREQQTDNAGDNHPVKTPQNAMRRASQGGQGRADVKTDAEGGQRDPEALICRIKEGEPLGNEHGYSHGQHLPCEQHIREQMFPGCLGRALGIISHGAASPS